MKKKFILILLMLTLSTGFCGCETKPTVSEKPPVTEDVEDTNMIQHPEDSTAVENDSAESTQPEMLPEEPTSEPLTEEPVEELSALTQMPEYSLFSPGWVTPDGNVILGSVAVVKVNDDLPYVGLTAYHFLNVFRQVDGMELPEYIQAGVLFDVDAQNETILAEVSKVWAMPNAEALTYGKDLAAFELADVSDLTVLPLAEGPCQKGEIIYLYADLVSEDEDLIASRLYPCEVIYDDGTELQYNLPSKYNTSGASGSPLVNSAGEVVGIHLSSNGDFRIAHSADSIRERLIEAYEYNK